MWEDEERTLREEVGRRFEEFEGFQGLLEDVEALWGFFPHRETQYSSMMEQQLLSVWGGWGRIILGGGRSYDTREEPDRGWSRDTREGDAP